MTAISNTDLELKLSSSNDSYRTLRCLYLLTSDLFGFWSQQRAWLLAECAGELSLPLCCLCIKGYFKHGSNTNSFIGVISKHPFVDNIPIDSENMTAQAVTEQYKQTHPAHEQLDDA